MIRIEVSHTFPVPVSEAFTYITDMRNWPAYWPDFIRIENLSEAKWSKPGDKSTVVIKLLNRERVEYGNERVPERRARHLRQPSTRAPRC